MAGFLWCPTCEGDAARASATCPELWHQSPADYYPPLVACRCCGHQKPTSQVRDPRHSDVANRGVCTSCQPPVDGLRSLLRIH